MNSPAPSKPKVVIPADDPPMVARSPYLEELSEIADVRLYRDRPGSQEQLVERLSEADILLNSRVAFRTSRELLAQLPNLKMMAVCGVGYDSVDLAAADAHGLVVCNVRGRTATVVAEHAFALMFAVARRIPQMTRELRGGKWSDELGLSLWRRQVGVIGTGNIGCEMIRLCRAVGMLSLIHI